MKKLLIAALALVVAAPLLARADEGPDLLLFGKSFHYGNDTKYNEVNPGIGLEYHWDNWFIGALTYKDSYSKQAYSAYGGYRYPWKLNEDWALIASLRVGYLHGSGFNGPVAFPSIGLQYKSVTLETLIVPKTCGSCAGVFGLFMRFSF